MTLMSLVETAEIQIRSYCCESGKPPLNLSASPPGLKCVKKTLKSEEIWFKIEKKKKKKPLIKTNIKRLGAVMVNEMNRMKQNHLMRY